MEGSNHMKYLFLVLICMANFSVYADNITTELPKIAINLAESIDLDRIHKIENNLGLNKFDLCLFDSDACLPKIDSGLYASSLMMPTVSIEQIENIDFANIHRMETALGLNGFDICLIWSPACMPAENPVVPLSSSELRPVPPFDLCLLFPEHC